MQEANNKSPLRSRQESMATHTHTHEDTTAGLLSIHVVYFEMPTPDLLNFEHGYLQHLCLGVREPLHSPAGHLQQEHRVPPVLRGSITELCHTLLLP